MASVHRLTNKEVRNMTVSVETQLSLCLSVNHAIEENAKMLDKLQVCVNEGWICQDIQDHFLYSSSHDYDKTKELMQDRADKELDKKQAMKDKMDVLKNDIVQLEVEIERLETLVKDPLSANTDVTIVEKGYTSTPEGDDMPYGNGS